jgi:hypothetical protein
MVSFIQQKYWSTHCGHGILLATGEAVIGNVKKQKKTNKIPALISINLKEKWTFRQRYYNRIVKCYYKKL